MKLAELLPLNRLPRAENYASPDRRWTFGDTEFAYLESGGHPLYDEHSISYELNSLGYRCPEFDDPSRVRMISIGCSYTYGVGLPQDALYHELFAKRLRSEMETSVVNWNLGSGAISNNYIARLLHLIVPKLQPHIILIFFTHLGRREYVTAANQSLKYRPNAGSNDPIQKNVFNHLSELSSQYDDQLNFFRDYKSIESLLRDRIWAYSFYRSSEITDIKDHLDSDLWAQDYKKLDKARDNSHLGPLTHQKIYEHFWSLFVQRDGLSRLKATL